MLMLVYIDILDILHFWLERTVSEVHKTSSCKTWTASLLILLEHYVWLESANVNLAYV